MLLLVRLHPDDLAIGLREAAEESRDRGLRPGEGIAGLLLDLIPGVEVQGRVRPEPPQDLAAVPRPEDPPPQVFQLSVDSRDLPHPGRMDLVGREVEGRVHMREPTVRGRAVGNVQDARLLVGPGARQDLPAQDLSQPEERGPDAVAHRGLDVGPEHLALFRRPTRVPLAGGFQQR